ncbi:hypothetical protein CG434_08765 [Pantoea ananatis]|nr:hypothetical protein CG434_08765 [Pantoea ananatis]
MDMNLFLISVRMNTVNPIPKQLPIFSILQKFVILDMCLLVVLLLLITENRQILTLLLFLEKKKIFQARGND